MTILHKPSLWELQPALFGRDEGEGDGPVGLPLAFLGALPHSAPGDCTFHRFLSQGRLRLSLQAPRDVGLPSGRIPRLLFAHLWAEAVRSKNPEILLARSWTRLCALLEIAPSGGLYGSIHPIKKQLRRLVDLTVSIAHQGERSLSYFHPVFAYELPQGAKPSAPIVVRFSQDFFERLLDEGPVPFVKHLHELQAPLAIDLYCLCTWLSRRISPKGEPQVVPWKELGQRLGADYKALRAFRHRVIQQMRTVLRLCPDWQAEANRDGLVVFPSRKAATLGKRSASAEKAR